MTNAHLLEIGHHVYLLIGLERAGKIRIADTEYLGELFKRQIGIVEMVVDVGTHFVHQRLGA